MTPVKTLVFNNGPLLLGRAWGAAEVGQRVAAIFEGVGGVPDDVNTPVLVKVDAAAGLPGPGGMTTDLRLVGAVLAWLQSRGFRRVQVGDSLPITRRGPAPSLLRRVRLDRLARHYGYHVVDLTSPTDQVALILPRGKVRVAAAAFGGYVIQLPTVAVHPLYGLTGATSGLAGLVHPDDRSLVEADPVPALLALEAALGRVLSLPDLLMVREGSHPPDDLHPLALGLVLGGRDPLVVDLVVARLLGMTPEEIPVLWKAVSSGRIPASVLSFVEDRISVFVDVEKPLRPPFDKPSPTFRWPWPRPKPPPLASEDTLGGLKRLASRCGDCHRCEGFCPTGLTRDQIGASPQVSACVECLYCWQVCPHDALELGGDPGPLAGWLTQQRKILPSLTVVEPS